ncbi:hypothetical protein DFH27DRAFT_584204 [Peziza echinospora]|nr:hypothetical protein DFH27DRAFT_584204 [Peziza echinospora]
MLRIAIHIVSCLDGVLGSDYLSCLVVGYLGGSDYLSCLVVYYLGGSDYLSCLVVYYLGVLGMLLSGVLGSSYGNCLSIVVRLFSFRVVCRVV